MVKCKILLLTRKRNIKKLAETIQTILKIKTPHQGIQLVLKILNLKTSRVHSNKKNQNNKLKTLIITQPKRINKTLFAMILLKMKKFTLNNLLKNKSLNSKKVSVNNLLRISKTNNH